MEKLREQYEKEVIPALMKKFEYKSVMQVPRLDKIVINIGLGDTKENPKSLENAMNDLTQITGQRPMITKAKKSIAAFKLREGANVGCKVTLRKDKMYVLSNKLKNYGAACIAYPYILDMLAGVLKENFYVLPSSVHEVIIVPESSQIRQSELERMVREINETQVPEEEILSNHAYFYYAQEGKLQLGKEMCIDREENE